jgi:DNA invertase Pin-like site-specific DNA recombinase
MKTTARVRRVGIYLRISDDRLKDEKGVKRQEDDCRLLAASLGWKIIGLYLDNDVSASDRRKVRKRYRQMLADIESGHIDAVIAWHPDRVYRQPAELEELILLVERMDTEIRTCLTGLIDLNNPAGRLNARLLGAIAGYETEHKSERIKRKIQELVEAGKIHNSGHRPFGYERVYSGEGPRRKIVEDRVSPVEARYVGEWADRVLEGETVYSLVVDANAKGILTSTGGPWSSQAMTYLLRSGRIAGLKEHKGEVVGKAVWPAIISVEKHTALRALLSDRGERAKEKGGRRTTARKFPLVGLVRCTCKVPHVIGEPCDCKEKGLEHHKMRTSPRGDSSVRIFGCSKDGGGCGARTIQIPHLEKAMEELLFRQLEEVEAAVGEDPDDPRPALETSLAKLERRRADLEGELDEGDRPIREITDALTRVKGRITSVQRELAELTVRHNVLDVGVDELRASWADYTVPRKQAVYRSLIEEILIHPATRPFNVFRPERIEVRWK